MARAGILALQFLAKCASYTLLRPLVRRDCQAGCNLVMPEPNTQGGLWPLFRTGINTCSVRGRCRHTETVRNKGDIMSKLSTTERASLCELEAIIDEGLKGFVSVGNSLKTILDAKLYRETHESFEAYLGERWRLGRSYAYKLMAGSEVASRVEGITNEGQARELLKVPYVDQDKVMSRAVQHAELEGREVTANDIKQATSEPSSMTARETVDEVWSEDNLTEMWDMSLEVTTELQEVLLKLAAHPQGCWLQAHADTLAIKVRDIKRVLVHCKPAGPCPTCMGGLQPKCEVCRSRGWLPLSRLNAVKKQIEQEEG